MCQADFSFLSILYGRIDWKKSQGVARERGKWRNMSQAAVGARVRVAGFWPNQQPLPGIHRCGRHACRGMGRTDESSCGKFEDLTSQGVSRRVTRVLSNENAVYTARILAGLDVVRSCCGARTDPG